MTIAIIYIDCVKALVSCLLNLVFKFDLIPVTKDHYHGKVNLKFHCA